MSPDPASSPLRIGWSSRDVTPDRPVILRGQFYARVSESVHDPLTVTALALDAGDDACVMVSADRVDVPAHLLSGVRERLKSAVSDLQPEKVFLSATHTHTAPEAVDGNWEDPGPDVMKPGEYAALFIDRTADCIAEAWRNRKPGALAWGYAHAAVGWNRRQVLLDGTSQMYGDTSADVFSHIEGYEDQGVNLVFTFDGNRRLTGTVVNLACPSQVTENAYFVSADFWHEARTELRRRHGADLFVLPQCSAAGDLSPHRMWNKRAEARMLKLKGRAKSDADLRMAERAEIGARIASAVDDALPAAEKDVRTEIRIRHVVRALDLPRRLITEDDVRDARREIDAYTDQLKSLAGRPPADRDRSFAFGRRRWFRGVLDRYELQKTRPAFPAEVHVVRLDDIAFATNPFELYLDFGLRIKARSQAVQTFVVQLAGPGTYLPTARSLGGGGYGSVPASNHVGPEGGALLVEETLRTLADLFA